MGGAQEKGEGTCLARVARARPLLCPIGVPWLKEAVEEANRIQPMVMNLKEGA